MGYEDVKREEIEREERGNRFRLIESILAHSHRQYASVADMIADVDMMVNFVMNGSEEVRLKDRKNERERLISGIRKRLKKAVAKKDPNRLRRKYTKKNAAYWKKKAK